MLRKADRKQNRFDESDWCMGIIKKICSKICNWWKQKSLGSKLLTVIGAAALCFILVIGISFAQIYIKDQKRRAALSAVDTTGRPINSRVLNGQVYVPNPNIVTILFFGIDSREKLFYDDMVPGTFGQSDIIMLAAYDTVNKTVKVVNVPRDSMVKVHRFATDGSRANYKREQITCQYGYGKNPDHCVELVKEILTEQIFNGLKIDYYVVINYGALPVIVDDIGGVTVTMSKDWFLPSTIYEASFKAGETATFNGTQAAEFIRARDIHVKESALDRLARQKDFLRGFYTDAKAAVKENPTLIGKIYGDLKDYMHTDLSLTEAVTLAMNAMDADFSVDNSVVVLPGEIGEGDDDEGIHHMEYYLDEEGVLQVMLDTWYTKWDGKQDTQTTESGDEQ